MNSAKSRVTNIVISMSVVSRGGHIQRPRRQYHWKEEEIKIGETTAEVDFTCIKSKCDDLRPPLTHYFKDLVWGGILTYRSWLVCNDFYVMFTNNYPATNPPHLEWFCTNSPVEEITTRLLGKPMWVTWDKILFLMLFVDDVPSAHRA